MVDILSPDRSDKPFGEAVTVRLWGVDLVIDYPLGRNEKQRRENDLKPG
jgi:hypothetical protein